MKAKPISRRSMLKGMGVVMSLPLLEAMGPIIAGAASKPGGRTSVSSPVRLGVLYMPNGVNPKAWTPEKCRARI